jgi:hypothetical protein
VNLVAVECEDSMARLTTPLIFPPSTHHRRTSRRGEKKFTV